MRELVPYKTVQGAARALDNGGRFFNLFAKSGDDVVDPAELARAAGVYAAGAQAFLYFEMALVNLSADEKTEIIQQLTPELMAKHKTNRPMMLAPSAVEAKGRQGKTAIVSGYPAFVEDRSQFTGFIVMVTPIIMMIPIFDQLDEYEVYDTPEMSTLRTVIATTRGSKRLDKIYTTFGGVLKELQFEDKTGKEHGLYLETMYYVPAETSTC